MGLKRIDVRVMDSTLSTIKKRAVSEGKAASEIVRALIEIGLEAGSSGSGIAHEIDTDKIREAVSSAVFEAMKEVGPGFPPEVLRYLVQDTAKTSAYVRKISLFLTEGKPKLHEGAVKVAEERGERILKKLKLDGIEDVDGIEYRIATPEDLRAMGIAPGQED